MGHLFLLLLLLLLLTATAGVMRVLMMVVARTRGMRADARVGQRWVCGPADAATTAVAELREDGCEDIEVHGTERGSGIRIYLSARECETDEREASRTGRLLQIICEAPEIFRKREIQQYRNGKAEGRKTQDTHTRFDYIEWTR